MCQLPETQLKYSRDRGTPLICDNAKLVGILSVIIPANITDSINVCTRTLRTNAFYTKISTYGKWIHSIIAVNSPTYSANGKPVPLVPLSPPFQSIAFRVFVYKLNFGNFLTRNNLVYTSQIQFQVDLFGPKTLHRILALIS